MITTRSLKEFVYLMPGNATRERVAEIIAMIEGKCRIVDERVALCPELVTICKTSYPIHISLPEGIVVIRGNSDGIMNMKPGLWTAPSAKTLVHLAGFGGSVIGTKVSKFKRTFGCSLYAEPDSWKVEIELKNARGLEKPERIVNLCLFSGLLELPVEFVSGQDQLVHREGLQATMTYLERDKDSAFLTCGLAEASFTLAFEKLMAAAKNKLSDWNIGYHATIPLEEWITEINRAQLPLGKAEITYTWRLRSHQHFAVMMEMAKLNEAKEAAQSLFEFEFAGGKRGQLDLMAHTKTGFKLWFSFDAKEDQLEFTQLTGIKLKEWN